MNRYKPADTWLYL